MGRAGLAVVELLACWRARWRSGLEYLQQWLQRSRTGHLASRQERRWRQLQQQLELGRKAETRSRLRVGLGTDFRLWLRLYNMVSTSIDNTMEWPWQKRWAGYSMCSQWRSRANQLRQWAGLFRSRCH